MACKGSGVRLPSAPPSPSGEMADALASGASAGNGVGVQVPSQAPVFYNNFFVYGALGFTHGHRVEVRPVQ